MSDSKSKMEAALKLDLEAIKKFQYASTNTVPNGDLLLDRICLAESHKYIGQLIARVEELEADHEALLRFALCCIDALPNSQGKTTKPDTNAQDVRQAGSKAGE